MEQGPKALTMPILARSNLKENFKENILAKINMDNHENIFTSVFKTMRNENLDER